MPLNPLTYDASVYVNVISVDSVMSVYSITSSYPTSPHPSLLCDEVWLTLPFLHFCHHWWLNEVGDIVNRCMITHSLRFGSVRCCECLRACMWIWYLIRRKAASHVKVMSSVWLEVVMVTITNGEKTRHSWNKELLSSCCDVWWNVEWNNRI